MLAVDDVGIAIADVYAKALFELAGAASQRASLLEELGDLVGYVNADDQFEEFLISVTIDPDARRRSIDKTMRGEASDLLVDFLQVLNRKDRLTLLEQVYIQYRLAHERSRNQVEVTVRSAIALSPTARESLVGALKAHTGCEPILTEEVSPLLIGGMLVYIGDKKIDFSVSNKLHELRSALGRRASQEILSSRSYFSDV